MNTSLPLNYFSSLQQLKFDAASEKSAHSEKTVEAMATQFESLFVNEMLKSMRATISENSLFGSDAINQYTEMYDQQLSLHIAQKGLGLKDVIISQLGGAKDNNAVVGWEDKSAFVRDLKQSLQENLPSGIDHKAIISMAALETGWGKKVIANSQGENSHNIFSIKANKSWGGDKAITQTTEFINGHRIHTAEPFRSYNSLGDAVSDFAEFIQKPRYEKAMSVADNGKAFIREIAAAGYATDPEYKDKLLRIYNDL